MVAAGAAEEVRAPRPPAPRPPPARRWDSRSSSRGDVEAMRRNTRRYAKRQLTWMRKLPGVLEVDLTGGDAAAAAERIRAALRQREGA